MASAKKSKAIVKYIDTLEPVSKARYLEKLKLIDGKDPYEQTITNKSSTEMDNFPDVTFPDIVNYLVSAQCAYTLADLKAFKSMESYNHFVCGWVKEVGHAIINNRSLLTARVRHSQRMNDTPLKPWIVAEKNGTILAAHCNCMAGLGEACSHIGAVLFYVDAAVKLRGAKTVTQEAAYWMLPTGLKSVQYRKVRDINFQSAKALKRKFDCSIPSVSPTTSRQGSIQMPSVPPSSDAERSAFLDKVCASKAESVLLSVLPKYSEAFIPECMSDKFPQILSEIRDDNCLNLSKIELFEHCKNLFDEIVVTEREANAVELETRDQAGNKNWHRFRIGRITASRVKAVCATTLSNPSVSLVNRICYPTANKFSTSATVWGCEHEKTAIDAYVQQQERHHHNFRCKSSGLVINPDYPHMGASPDSLISCDCCGEGVVEVKCPYCVRHQKIDESVDAKSCLEMTDSNLTLKRSHAYFYQIQTQMLVCKRDFCDFVLWTENDMHIERFVPDEQLIQKIISTATIFFKQVILPELVCKMIARQQPQI